MKASVIVGDVEMAAEKALAFIRGAEKAEPAVAGALGVVLGTFDKALSDANTVAQNPNQALNIQFDQQVFADLKAVWPNVKSFLQTLGVKL